MRRPDEEPMSSAATRRSKLSTVLMSIAMLFLLTGAMERKGSLIEKSDAFPVAIGTFDVFLKGKEGWAFHARSEFSKRKENFRITIKSKDKPDAMDVKFSKLKDNYYIQQIKRRGKNYRFYLVKVLNKDQVMTCAHGSIGSVLTRRLTDEFVKKGSLPRDVADAGKSPKQASSISLFTPFSFETYNKKFDLAFIRDALNKADLVCEPFLRIVRVN